MDLGYRIGSIMKGTFTYSNPTRLHFGEEALGKLAGELAGFGPVVMLSYGKASIKKSGLYDRVMEILRAAGKTVVEDPGVMPNPTVEKLREGARLARENKVDLILAVGGGSVCDYAKGVSVAAYCDADPWEKYYVRMAPVDNAIIPVGCVLTMAGTGSEMNGGSVITNHAVKRKIGRVFGDAVFPRFSILDPVLTLTLPRYQMVAGCFDVMSHILEQYLSGTDDNTSDYIAEGLMRSLAHSTAYRKGFTEGYEAGREEGFKQSAMMTIHRTYGAILCAAHELYGFGQDRGVRLLNRMHEVLVEMLTDEELAQRVLDEVGVEIDWGQPIDLAQPKEPQRKNKHTKEAR